MAWFLVRVELHGAKAWEDYDELHEAMEAFGFSRTIVSDNGVEYHLPPAEYYIEGELELEQVCDKAKRAAARTGYSYAVLAALRHRVQVVWTGSGGPAGPPLTIRPRLIRFCFFGRLRNLDGILAVEVLHAHVEQFAGREAALQQR